jgi:ribosome-binding protein aMBF1 (putative translation factor)
LRAKEEWMADESRRPGSTRPRQTGEGEGRALRAARLVRGISGNALSQSSGISSDKIYRIERGDALPDAGELRALWTALVSGS